MRKEFYGLLTLAQFLAWQGDDLNPAPGTVNALLYPGGTPGRFTRMTFPSRHRASCVLEKNRTGMITKISGPQEVCFVVPHYCPASKRTELLTLMNKKRFYRRDECREMGFFTEWGIE
jgi:hypothetical protein